MYFIPNEQIYILNVIIRFQLFIAICITPVVRNAVRDWKGNIMWTLKRDVFDGFMRNCVSCWANTVIIYIILTHVLASVRGPAGKCRLWGILKFVAIFAKNISKVSPREIQTISVGLQYLFNTAVRIAKIAIFSLFGSYTIWKKKKKKVKSRWIILCSVFSDNGRFKTRAPIQRWNYNI